MNEPNLLGEFLRARRELARPADAGVIDDGRRRVRGLRREEMAMLAGVSTDYYNRLEQGRDRHPSPEVVTALARVFGLDDDSLAHLRDLADPRRPRRRPARKPERISPGTLQVLQLLSGSPALVQTRFRDVLACTTLAAALHPGLLREPNMLRLLFLNPAQKDFYPDWERVARESVAWLRAAAGDDLRHPRLTCLVGELSLNSEDFGRFWNRHDVRMKSSGTWRGMHPIVGGLTVGYETFAVNASPGQFLTVCHAVPGSRDADALALLASHAATTPVGQKPGQAGVVVFDQPPAGGLHASRSPTLIGEHGPTARPSLA